MYVHVCMYDMYVMGGGDEVGEGVMGDGVDVMGEG